MNFSLIESREKISCEQMVCSAQLLYLSFYELPIIIDSKPEIANSSPPHHQPCHVLSKFPQGESQLEATLGFALHRGSPSEHVGVEAAEASSKAVSGKVTELNGTPVPPSVR